MEKDIKKGLEYSSGDYIYATAKAAAGIFPYLGGAFSEAIGLAITQPLSKRKDEWLVRLYESIKDLELRVDNFDIEKLKDNEQFITVVLKASQIVIRNHTLEKERALLNACVNTAINISIDENEQLMFLNYVDELTVWHLKILYYFVNPTERLKEKSIDINKYYMGSPIGPLLEYYPELSGRDEFIRIIVKDLYSRSLFNTESLNGTMTANGMVASRLSEFGKRFMQYIGKTGI